MGVWRENSMHAYLGTRLKWEVVSRPGLILPRGKSPRYPLYRSIGGRCTEYKNILNLPRIKPRFLSRLIRSLIAIQNTK
jgi:hypothetical protein